MRIEKAVQRDKRCNDWSCKKPRDAGKNRESLSLDRLVKLIESFAL